MSDEIVLAFDPDVNSAIVRFTELQRAYKLVETAEFDGEDDGTGFRQALLDSIHEEQKMILHELKKIYNSLQSFGEDDE